MLNHVFTVATIVAALALLVAEWRRLLTPAVAERLLVVLLAVLTAIHLAQGEWLHAAVLGLLLGGHVWLMRRARPCPGCPECREVIQ
jgi:hypothetical protein